MKITLRMEYRNCAILTLSKKLPISQPAYEREGKEEEEEEIYLPCCCCSAVVVSTKKKSEWGRIKEIGTSGC